MYSATVLGRAFEGVMVFILPTAPGMVPLTRLWRFGDRTPATVQFWSHPCLLLFDWSLRGSFGVRRCWRYAVTCANEGGWWRAGWFLRSVGNTCLDYFCVGGLGVGRVIRSTKSL